MAHKQEKSGKLSSFKKAVPIALLIIGWFFIGWFARGYFLFPQDTERALLDQARFAINNRYIGEAPAERELTYAAIRGMLGSIDDKYAAFHPPALAGRNSGELEGNTAVVGLRGEMQDGQFVVLDVVPGGPAEAAGVLAGDVITQIDGWDVKASAEYYEVVSMVRGPQGSTAQLRVNRGGQELTFAIPRESVPDVTSDTLAGNAGNAGNIAYLRFDSFTEKTASAVEQALKEQLAANPKGLVLDLRYNGGGLMNATQAVLDFFLDEGVAFYARTKDGQLLSYPTKTGDLAEKIPLVVLIGPHTYSAPETVAASIADRKRGLLMGETTYGKGAIRETIPLVDGSSIQISVAQWLSPVKQTYYEGRGVAPDQVVKEDPTSDRDPVMDAAIEYLQNNQ